MKLFYHTCGRVWSILHCTWNEFCRKHNTFKYEMLCAIFFKIIPLLSLLILRTFFAFVLTCTQAYFGMKFPWKIIFSPFLHKQYNLANLKGTVTTIIIVPYNNKSTGISLHSLSTFKNTKYLEHVWNSNRILRKDYLCNTFVIFQMQMVRVNSSCLLLYGILMGLILHRVHTKLMNFSAFSLHTKMRLWTLKWRTTMIAFHSFAIFPSWF